jgi:cytochrome c oxidase cbb3-type subunit 3
MSSAWHWFVIIGTVASLVGFLWFLFANRRISGEETTGHEADGIQELDNPLPAWWVGMFVASIVFAFGYLAYYPGFGNFSGTGSWSSASQLESAESAHEARFAPVYARLAGLDPEALRSDRLAQQVGRRLFINHCSTCHGVTARGSVGFPDLTDAEWIWGPGFETVQATILRGRTAIMPPWGPALGETGVSDVTQTVLKLAGREHNSAAALRGEAHYKTICVACHGLAGEGNPLLGGPDLSNDIWLYGGTTDAIASSISAGRTGIMPAQADLLSDHQVHILAGYVTSLDRSQQDQSRQQ